MRLYNPTPEAIPAKFDGKVYDVLAGKTIEVAELVGHWILERCSMRGLVPLDFKLSENIKDTKKNFQKYLVEQTYKGLELYIQMKNEVLQQWINLDTEIKSENQYGTVLQNKDVTTHNKWIQIARSMIKDLETKYSVSFEKDEIIQKSNELQGSIDDIIKAFEADSEKQNLAKKQENELNALINDLMPKTINMSGNANISI